MGSSMPKRTNTIHVGPLRARKVRGPGKRDPRPYWKVTTYADGGEALRWSGRGTRDEVEAQMIAMAHEGIPEPRRRKVKGPDTARVETIGQVLGAHLSHLRRTGKAQDGTLRGYKSYARAIRSHIGDVSVRQFRSSHVVDLVQGLRRPTERTPGGYRDSTLSKVLMQLRAAWRHAVDRRLVTDREIDWTHLATYNASRTPEVKHTPTAGDVVAVLAHLRSLEPRLQWRHDLVLLQWATGCRIGEMASARVRDVDLARGVIELGIHKGAAKTGARLAHVVDPAALAVLRKRTEGRHPDARVIHEVSISRAKTATPWLRPACEAAGVKVFTSHGLRRAYVTIQLRRGVDDKVLAMQTGHDVATMRRAYQDVQTEDIGAALAAAGAGSLPSGRVLEYDARKRREGE